jgi:hypothetical protein
LNAHAQNANGDNCTAAITKIKPLILNKKELPLNFNHQSKRESALQIVESESVSNYMKC